MSETIINAEAAAKLQEVDSLAAKLGAAEAQLEAGYGQLAVGLKEISEHRYWEGTYENFGEYMSHLSEKHKMGNRQLYNYLTVARELSSVSPLQLSTMGISKALVLRDSAKHSGMIDQAHIEAALDPKVTVKDLKRILFEAKVSPKLEDGTWLDAEFEFYVNDEERAELHAAANAARHMEPPISQTLTEMMQRKEIALRWAREFLSTHAESIVEGGKGL
jgi:hypothetical protein